MMRSRRQLIAAAAAAAVTACALMLGTANAADRVAVFESASAARIAASQQGKPFVLVVWSLDCVYCKRNFDALGKLRAQHPGLRVVTLATDSAEASPQVQKTLERVRLTRNAWVFGHEPQERLRYAVDPDWMGEMPRTYFYRADGQRQGVSGVISEADWARHLRWAGIAG
ncbi:TlpA family protein disulfide reductase [Cupriavidus taiwanensis]|uniref:TlpA family protein disulfide reductase n=1 Tax=Cupriavidus taiwanensis TaxID=164546 RepID=UPI0039C2E0FC